MTYRYRDIALFYEFFVREVLKCERFVNGASTSYYYDACSDYDRIITEKNVKQKKKYEKDLERDLKNIKRALTKVVNKAVYNKADKNLFLTRIQNSDFLGITIVIGMLRGYLHF